MRLILIFLLLFASNLFADTLNTYYQEGSAPKYFHEQEELHGICIEYIDKLNHIMVSDNIQIKLLRGANFSRIKKDLKSGRISVFFGITKTEERLKVYDYGDPLYSIRYSFAVPVEDNYDYIKSTNLGNKRIGVIAGTKSAKYLKENYTGVNLITANSIEQALRMLNSKRIDGVFYHDLGLEHQIKNLDFKDSVKVSLSSAETKLQYFAFSKNTPEKFKNAVEKAFAEIVASGEQAIMLRRYGIYNTYSQVAGL